MKKLSVILVSYNVCYFLEQALLALRQALQGLEAEVWVVDNNSRDQSVEMVRRRFPEVNLLVNEQNLGFAKANNQALALARGQYVLLLNPDTVVAEDSLRLCLEFMDRHPQAGGLGVQMIDGQGRFLPESMRGLPSPAVAFYKISGLTALFPRSRRFGRYYLGFLDPGQVQEVEVLAGAFMLLRQASLEKTGGLDESFFMYGEDIDLSCRLLQAGYRNYYLPQARIIHYKGESTRRGSLQYVWRFYRAMAVFVNKHYSGGKAFLLSKVLYLAIAARAGIALVSRVLSGLLPAGSAGQAGTRRMAVAGGQAEYQRAAGLLQKAGVPGSLLGFICPGPAAGSDPACLGTLNQLADLCRRHGVEELIFCSRDLAASQIMDCMVALQGQGLFYKNLPPDCDFILGSDSPKSRGDYYAGPQNPAPGRVPG